MAQTFPWRGDFQNVLISCLVNHSDQFVSLARELKPNYFVGVQPTLVARCLLDYQAAQDRFPSWTVLRELASRAVGAIPGNRDPETMITFIDELQKTDTRDWNFVRDNLAKYIKERAVNAALVQAVQYLKEDKIPQGGLAPLFDEAARAGQNLDDLGFLFHADVDRVVEMVTDTKYGTATGFPLLDKIWRNGWGPGWLIVPLAPPKHYKCLGLGTPVMMADGSVKVVEDIQTEDCLMGDDLSPRIVKACGQDRGPLYRVEQELGDDFICNDVHILCLQSPCGTFKLMDAQDYSRKSETFKATWQGYKAMNGGTLRYPIDVIPIGDGDYYGFEINGNRQFLLGDFTVTHNTGFCINIACNIVSPQIEGDVIYYACEISQELAMCRAMCNISGLDHDYMYDSPEKFSLQVKAKMKEACAGNLLFKSFSSKSASILDIRQHAKMAVAQLGLNLKAIVIDYAETVLPSGSEKGDPEYRKSAAVYTEARALGGEMRCPVIMPDRCNRKTTEEAVPNMTSFQGSFEKAGIVDVGLGLCSTEEERRGNILRIFNFIGRHSAAGQHLRGRVDPLTWRMEFNEEVAYAEEKEMQEQAEEGKRGRSSRSKRTSVPAELTENA